MDFILPCSNVSLVVNVCSHNVALIPNAFSIWRIKNAHAYWMKWKWSDINPLVRHLEIILDISLFIDEEKMAGWKWPFYLIRIIYVVR